MLAYLFWHCPGEGVDPGAYERAQGVFHASLDTPSASFRLEQLPFRAEAGYEDWYLTESWEALGDLNRLAVDAVRRSDHDHAASMSARGWGAVYSLARGPSAIPDETEWRDKAREEPYEEFVGSLPGTAVWQRQMVLGPAPEFCLAVQPTAARTRIFPAP